MILSVFSASDLLRLGTADTSTLEVKRLAHYCLEIREVLFLMADDECDENENGHCEAHKTTMNIKPFKVIHMLATPEVLKRLGKLIAEWKIREEKYKQPSSGWPADAVLVCRRDIEQLVTDIVSGG